MDTGGKGAGWDEMKVCFGVGPSSPDSRQIFPTMILCQAGVVPASAFSHKGRSTSHPHRTLLLSSERNSVLSTTMDPTFRSIVSPAKCCFWALGPLKSRGRWDTDAGVPGRTEHPQSTWSFMSILCEFGWIKKAIRFDKM